MSTIFSVYLVGTVAVVLMIAVFEEEKYQNIQLGRKKNEFRYKNGHNHFCCSELRGQSLGHSSKMHLYLEESLSGRASNCRLQFSETDDRVY